MGAPWVCLSVIFFNIYMFKTELGFVTPVQLELYKIFVNDTINRREKEQPDTLNEKLDNHPNI